MNFSFAAWCWEEWQERLSPWRWGFQLTGTTLTSLITRLPLASAAASLQPWIYIYLSCCHLYFRRSTTLSLLHVTHRFPWEWPASCALSTLPSTPPHTQTYRPSHSVGSTSARPPLCPPSNLWPGPNNQPEATMLPGSCPKRITNNSLLKTIGLQTLSIFLFGRTMLHVGS